MQPHDRTAGQPQTGKIVTVFFGMTASGKSTLGMAWADRCQATYYNTDRVRKELAGLQVSAKRPDEVGQGIYTAAFTEKTYLAMLDHVREDFARGRRQVVLDGSYGRREDRDRVRSVAEELGARCVFLFCTCPEDEVRRRLERRSRDPQAVSDGRWEIYLHQRQTFEMPDAVSENDCIWLNTDQPIEAMLTWLSARPYLQG